MRKPAITPPVFDPRTINPNRVPTGLKVLIVASFMIAVGFGTLAVGGLLTIVGVVLRRTAPPRPVEEDQLLEEHYGSDSVVNEYDPLELNPHLRTREQRRGHR